MDGVTFFLLTIKSLSIVLIFVQRTNDTILDSRSNPLGEEVSNHSNDFKEAHREMSKPFPRIVLAGLGEEEVVVDDGLQVRSRRDLSLNKITEIRDAMNATTADSSMMGILFFFFVFVCIDILVVDVSII